MVQSFRYTSERDPNLIIYQRLRSLGVREPFFNPKSCKPMLIWHTTQKIRIFLWHHLWIKSNSFETHFADFISVVQQIQMQISKILLKSWIDYPTVSRIRHQQQSNSCETNEKLNSYCKIAISCEQLFVFPTIYEKNCCNIL